MSALCSFVARLVDATAGHGRRVPRLLDPPRQYDWSPRSVGAKLLRDATRERVASDETLASRHRSESHPLRIGEGHDKSRRPQDLLGIDAYNDQDARAALEELPQIAYLTAFLPLYKEQVNPSDDIKLQHELHRRRGR